MPNKEWKKKNKGERWQRGETLNTVIMAADRVTTPDESSSGLVVNFHYTDVDEDDRALGGHYFNQTPLNPGNSTVGQRAIL